MRRGPVVTGRRQLLITAGASLLFPSVAFAQSAKKVFQVGVLAQISPEGANAPFQILRQALADLEYEEGRNVVFHLRFTENPKALGDTAKNLVRENVDLIIAVAVPAALAAKRATQTIPIVMIAGGDPVQYGLVGSLARPGGNITGTAALSPELIAKQLELLRETLPRLSRVAVLGNAANRAHQLQWNEIKESGRVLRIQMEAIQVLGPKDFEDAYARIAASRVDALQILPDSLTFGNLSGIAAVANASKIPSVFFYGEYPEVGGLMSYGPKLSDGIRASARYVDKIFKGERAADLPIQQPTSFELVINRKTANALGINISSSLRLRADRVIE